MRNDLYLPVEIAGLIFKNPFYVASGPTTKSVRQLKRIEETGWSAASIKLTIDPAPYINRVPRYAVFEDRNALCFTAEKRLKFDEGLKLMEEAKRELKELILMANITYAGELGAEGWVNMARRFEETGADIIELNMCCPNMSYNVELSSGDEECCKVRTGASLGQQGDAVAEIVREIKKVISIPIFVKLTPEGGKIAQVAKSLYAAGADAVGGTANRLGIPPINLDNPGSSAYHLQDEISMSCHSGAWLKPLALRDTYEIRKVNGPEPRIMSAGGVKNYRDAAEMIMCGADLVGICAETLISGFGFIEGLISDLKIYMEDHGYKTVREMRDQVVPLVRSAPELTLYKGFAQINKPELAAPCKAACPHHIPAQAYVRAVAKKDIKRAYELIMGKNPLQSVCGWVCNHACEEACTRGEIGTPVPIKDIKRFVIEYGEKMGWEWCNAVYAVNIERSEKIAVVGSGPAGLSAAWNLATAGYRVTVFEKEKYPGGMLRYGLPAFRMNHAVLDKEIQTLKGLGINFETEKALGREISIDSLKKLGFKAVFIGIGAHQGHTLRIPGVNSKGVMSAIDYLKAVNKSYINAGIKLQIKPENESWNESSNMNDTRSGDEPGKKLEIMQENKLEIKSWNESDNMPETRSGDDLGKKLEIMQENKLEIKSGNESGNTPETRSGDEPGKKLEIMSENELEYDGVSLTSPKRVVVVGGGYTAVDAARTAIRLGAKEVYIVYRRTKDEMPASSEEIAEAEAEGVKIMYLVSPKAIIAKDGYVSGVCMVNQVLGNKDTSNRRKPQSVDDAEFILSCDMVITATGQKPEESAVKGLALDGGGMLLCNPSTGETSIHGVYSGGDVNDVATVISAIAAGKRAACSIDRFLAGEKAVLVYEQEYPAVNKEAVLSRTGYFTDDDRLDLYTAIGYERNKNFTTYTRALTEEEAVKEAQRCLNCGCGEGCGLCASICSEFAIHTKEPDIWKIDKDECVACGMCYNLCPNKNIQMINENILVK